MKSLIQEEKYMVTFADFCMCLDPLDEALYVSSYMQVTGSHSCFLPKNLMKKGLKLSKRWEVGS
jgi:hypothetical protein